MRIITENDKKGLVAALRVFVRAISGEKLTSAAGAALLDKALNEGLSVDELLNKENWGRAIAVIPNLMAADYIDALCTRQIEIRPLSEENGWHEPENGFAVITEAAHDFYLAVTGKGGKWNIPSAMSNLAAAVQHYSLEAILSEKLALEVKEAKGETTFFDYILAIVKDVNSLHIETEPTEAEIRRREEGESLDNENPDAENIPAEHEPEDGPYPDSESSGTGFDTTFLMPDEPRNFKLNSLRMIIGGYNPGEIKGIVKTIPGYEELTIDEIFQKLAEGDFDPALEDPAARQIHMSLSGDLMPSFIDCVRMQGIEMDDQIASRFDILHDSWDLRDTAIRKLHKLKRLIFLYGADDPDILAAVKDLEYLYNSKE